MIFFIVYIMYSGGFKGVNEGSYLSLHDENSALVPPFWQEEDPDQNALIF